MPDKQKPAEVRIGAIKATIWTNESESGPWHSVTFSRLYKDGEEWKNTGNFRRDDLLLLAKVVDHAHTRILELQQHAPQSQTD